MLRLLRPLIAAALAALALPSARADDTPAVPAGVGVATFGSGCFWCTEADFDKVDGVLTTTSGYMGGHLASPTYDAVGTGRTGHVEVLQITFDTTKVSYRQLLEHYWRTTDVTDGGGQFCDRGNQYRPVIFAHDAEQLALAEAGRATLAKLFVVPIAVEIKPARPFTRAEAEHQDFHTRERGHYARYRKGCGRDARLEKIWKGKPLISDIILKR